MSSRYYERDYGRDYGRYDQSERDSGRDYSRDYGRYGRDDYGESRYGRGYDYDDARGYAGRGEGRGFTDRASDEVRSWFGDDEAERRRRMDEQRYGRESYGRESFGSDYGRSGGESYYGRTYAASLGQQGGGGEDSILLKLGDTNFDVAGGDDIRGRRVMDQSGNDIGDVSDLIVDERNRRVRFLLVTSGGFLGIGATTMLVPVSAITDIHREGVTISTRGGRGLGSVRYEPTLIDRRSYAGESAGSRSGYSTAAWRRGRAPRGYKRSDERIREDVNDRLSDDPFIDASDVEVNVSSGEVTLSGTVNSRADKRRAEDIAEAVSAVTHVQNNLRINRGELGAATAGTTLGTGATGTTTDTATAAAAGTTTTGARRGTAAGGTT